MLGHKEKKKKKKERKKGEKTFGSWNNFILRRRRGLEEEGGGKKRQETLQVFFGWGGVGWGRKGCLLQIRRRRERGKKSALKLPHKCLSV